MIIVLSTLALIAALATVAALVTLHLLPTGLSPLSDPVSAYGISRFRALYRVQTLATAAAAVALAAAFALASPAAVPVIVSLAALALARATISWFPMDAPGAARTRSGRIHNLLAFGAFAAASVSGFMGAIAFAQVAGLERFADVSNAFGWAMSAASALTIAAALARPLGRIFGLAERLIYVGMLGWLGFSAIVLALHEGAAT